MLTIRFLRTGKKNQPFFRIVVTDKKNPPKGGRFLEIVGFFNPITKEKKLKAERIKYWLSVGAKTSDRVHNLLVSEKIIKAKKINVLKKTRKKKGDKEKGEKQTNLDNSAGQATNGTQSKETEEGIKKEEKEKGKEEENKEEKAGKG
ncbi:30S ribosomal protein S16, partial [bacterium]|nr:30S ribosomal protein S16 [bacterium]